ncbi:MAG: CHAT domain-containing protein [Planctomycetota bacterium]|jgi:hypothetical protein
MNGSVDAWIEAASSDDRGALARLIASLPESVSQGASAGLAAGSASVETRVYALRAVSQDHSVGGDPQTGVVIATAGMRFCMRCFEALGPGAADTYRFGVSQFAVDAHRAFDRMDAHEKQLAVVEEALRWLEARAADERHCTDLRFARIEALIELGELERARAALDAEAGAGRQDHHLYGMLDGRLRGRLVPATELKDRRSPEQRAGDERVESLGAAIEGLASIAPEFAGALSTLGEQLADEAPPPARESIERANRLYTSLAGFLGRQAGGDGGQLQLSAAIQQASIVLADERDGHDPRQLESTRRTLEEIRREALARGYEDTAEDTLWPLYVCCRRLNMMEPALGALQEIRRCVDAQRARIADPLKRAGLASKYPHLHVELCARLAETGDDRELLSVIEEAKGRALADMLAVEAEREDAPWPSGAAGDWLPGHMEALGAHYLSYLTDDEVTYAVLVARDGSVHSFTVPLGERVLGTLRRDLDPSRWGAADGLFGRRPADVAQQLAPLVEALGPLFDHGLLREDDHVCYAPDGLLHLVPLHYVAFLGAPLVSRVSMSRTHCAALMWSATQSDASRPDHFVAVEVPTAEEVAEDAAKVEELGGVRRWLGEHLAGRTLIGAGADIDAVAAAETAAAVVHFATHGVFPDHASGANPYRSSGLVLGTGGRLPTKDGAFGLLCPDFIVGAGSAFDFAGSHVTMQACVSGLSEEGVGGDALGLEWSLLMAGARSVLSTHWHIPVRSSAEFSTRFYDEWLVRGAGRGAAWRTAVLGLMDGDPFLGANAYHWAPFSLAGDWR